MGLNNVLPNAHFRKHWQRYVRTWFDQPGKKKSRRIARLKKAAQIAPRPVDGLLRPVVRGQTLKYNMRIRAGRGFTLEELKQAGIRKKEARSIGIAVDHRRKNRSEEGLSVNVERLKEYKSRLVLLPKNSRKQRAQRKGFKFPEGIQTTGMILPITQLKPSELEGTVTQSTGPGAFSTLRNARAEARLVGVRVKRMKSAAANV